MADATNAGISFYAAERPCEGETVSGDAWTMQRRGEVYRFAVIDGLGHGEGAYEAAVAAVQALEARPELGPVDAVSLCHHALRGTRGAAVSVAELDLERRTLAFCGIGNVEGILLHDGAQDRLVPFRGIVGANMPRLRSFELPLEGEWLLLLHSDGISSRVTVDHWKPGSSLDEKQRFADDLLESWGRGHDDVTVLIVCSP